MWAFAPVVLTLSLAASGTFGAALDLSPTHPRVAVDRDDIARVRARLKAGDPMAESLLASWKSSAEFLFQHKPADVPKGYTLQENYVPCPKDGYELRVIGYDHPEMKCPKCGKVYHGGEYDAVWRHQFHLKMKGAVLQAAYVYAFTGQERYADAVRNMLLWYADNYDRYRGREQKKKGRRGYFLDNPLRESYFVYDMPVAYDLLYNYQGFTPAERKHIENDLLRACAQTLIDHPNTMSNFQTFQNAGIGAVGFCLGDEKLIDIALHRPDNGFDAQMEKGVVDGLWHEGSLAYHFFTLSALIELAEAARRNGIDLYANPNLKAMFHGPLQCAWPNGDVPRFGDDRSSGWSLARSFQSYWEVAWARYHDPIFLHLLQCIYTVNGVKRSPNVLLEDCAAEIPKPVKAVQIFNLRGSLMSSAGLAFLRRPDIACMVKFGPKPAWHDHFDKLELLVWALGREMGFDPGMCAQYAFPERSWYRGPIGHNCVIVDEQRYGDCCGECEAFAPDGSIQLLVTTMNTAYKDVEMERTQVLGEGFLLDVYSVKGGSIHDWAFHSHGTLTVSVPLRPGPRPGEEWKNLPKVVGGNLHYHADLTNGYEYLKNVERGKADKMWSASWEIKAGRLRMTMAADPSTEVIRALGLGYWNGPAAPMILVRRRQPESVYAAVFEAIPKSGEERPPATIETRTKDSMTIVDASGAWGDVRLMLNAGGAWSGENVRTDARIIALFSKKRGGAPAAMLVGKGNYVEAAGRRIDLKKGDATILVRQDEIWRATIKPLPHPADGE